MVKVEKVNYVLKDASFIVEIYFKPENLTNKDIKNLDNIISKSKLVSISPPTPSLNKLYVYKVTFISDTPKETMNEMFRAFDTNGFLFLLAYNDDGLFDVFARMFLDVFQV
jgi:hypothetical protein